MVKALPSPIVLLSIINEATKTCIVFNASSKVGTVYTDSLALPCILPLIFDIQLRFRFGEKASIVYIQLAFLNIEIDISNRDFDIPVG